MDFVVVGPETGSGRRPCKNEWIADIVDQCKAAGVPCFVKKAMDGKGKPTADMSLWPAEIRVRELLA